MQLLEVKFSLIPKSRLKQSFHSKNQNLRNLFVYWRRLLVSRSNTPFCPSYTALDGLLISQSNRVLLSDYTINRPTDRVHRFIILYLKRTSLNRGRDGLKCSKNGLDLYVFRNNKWRICALRLFLPRSTPTCGIYHGFTRCSHASRSGK